MSKKYVSRNKRRSTNKTILICGEGLGEEVFLKHLRSLYSRDKNLAITIRRGNGGSADGLVVYTDRILGAFDKKVAVLDNDKSKTEMQRAREEGIKRKIELLENTPCLESVLLSILHGGRSFNLKVSRWCKQEFESKYLDRKKRADYHEYPKLFPKSLLDKNISKIQELRKLICLVEGKTLKKDN